MQEISKGRLPATDKILWAIVFSIPNIADVTSRWRSTRARSCVIVLRNKVAANVCQSSPAAGIRRFGDKLMLFVVRFGEV